MGGAINYRNPDRAEHNFRLDPAAAIEAVTAARQLWLVVSDVTFRLEIELTANHPLYLRLAEHPEAWARLLHEQLDRWFERFVPRTMQQRLASADNGTAVTARRLRLLPHRTRSRCQDATRHPGKAHLPQPVGGVQTLYAVARRPAGTYGTIGMLHPFERQRQHNGSTRTGWRTCDKLSP